MKIFFALFGLLIWVSQNAAASPINPQTRSLPSSALAIYQNSSTEIRVEQYAPRISKNFLSIGITSSRVNKDARKQIQAAIESAYSPRVFQQHLIESLEKSLTSAEQMEVLQWLGSPTGSKASLLEAQALIEAHLVGPNKTMESARSGSYAASKRKLLDTVNMASMAGDLQVDVAIFQSSAASFAANASPNQIAAPDYRVFYRATKARRAEIAKINYNYSLAVQTNAFGSFSEKELKELVSFWGSPTGSRYAFALRDGINNAFFEACKQLNYEVAEIIGAVNINLAQID